MVEKDNTGVTLDSINELWNILQHKIESSSLSSLDKKSLLDKYSSALTLMRSEIKDCGYVQ